MGVSVSSFFAEDACPTKKKTLPVEGLVSIVGPLHRLCILVGRRCLHFNKMESYSKWTFKTGTRATMLTGRVIYFGTLPSFLSMFAAKLDAVSDQYLSLLSKLHFK